jgi:putative oxidoreductase
MTALQPVGLLVGRVLLALLFILSGFGKLTGFAATAGYMASKGLPFAELLLILTIVIELGGGVMIAIGYKARWAALVIFLFLIPVTLIFHNFWAVEASELRGQMIQFQKNLAIMGGMLYILFSGAGRYSLDKD